MKFGIKVDFGPGFSLRGQSGFSKTLGGELVAFTERVMSDVRDMAAANTPRKTGAASRAWKKQGSKTDTVVENTKPYIRRLDEGSSRQAPGGILKPTLKEIRRKYR